MRTAVFWILGAAIFVTAISSMMTTYSDHKVHEWQMRQHEALIQRVEALEEKCK